MKNTQATSLRLYMKKLLTIILLTVMTLSLQAEIITDTISAGLLIEQFGVEQLDSLLIEKMHQQALAIAARNDSIHNWRLRNDTTTLNPFHLGYRDSILAAVDRAEQRYFLSKYKLYTVPQFWNKHYIFELKNDSAVFDFVDPDKSDLKLKKVGSVLLLADNKYGLKADDSDLTMDLPTIDTEKTWAPDIDKNKKIKLLQPAYQKHWYKEATIQLQVTQNYVTKNWYTGGSSNFAVLGIVTGKLNFNDFKQMTWENTLEWRAGAGSNSADTIRKVSTTEDYFRLYSKFNYKAVSKIYYSVSGEFITQFYDTYKEPNSIVLVTSLFTPVRFNLNAGMDFKPVKGLSIAVSPLSFKYVHVRDTTRIQQTNFSIARGQKSLREVGSSLRIEYTYKPAKELALEGKFYFYTNYRKVELDLEFTANIIFNQYMSARINLHPRYDNTVILTGQDKAEIQFKEFISVGFAHRFR